MKKETAAYLALCGFAAICCAVVTYPSVQKIEALKKALDTARIINGMPLKRRAGIAWKVIRGKLPTL